MDNDIQQEFKELLSEVIQDEIKIYLKNNNYYHLVTGKIVAKKNGRYSIDIGDTFINDIVNKSGMTLQIGDTVTLMEKAESNYSNCFILCKNGLEESTVSYVEKDEETGEDITVELNTKIAELNTKITELQNSSNTMSSQITELEAREGYLYEPNANGFAYVNMNGHKYRVNILY